MKRGESMSVFQLTTPDDELQHYGVLGMKWGIRKDPHKAYTKSYSKLEKLDAKATKAAAKAGQKEVRSLRKQQRADSALFLQRSKSRAAARAIRRSERARAKYVGKATQAVSWYKQMEYEFGKTKIKDLNPKRSELGKKYVNKTIESMMQNAQTSVANKQLRNMYLRSSKR